MKKIIFSTFLACFTLVSFAQETYEAFRFSQIDYQGTARYMGTAGAFSSIGGDFSALNSNPASIGLFKRCDVSLTPMALSLINTTTTLLETPSYARKTKYTVPQCGIVLTKSIEKSPWKFWQFGFGYNRIMDYNNTFRTSAINNNSFVNAILEQVNSANTHYSSLTGDGLLAWETWMIDTIQGNTHQFFSPFSDQAVDQNAIIKQTGAIDELTFTFGSNYDDKLFIGGTLGFPFLEYTEETTLTEQPTEENDFMGITSTTIKTYQKNKGTGINFRFGMLYQPIPFLRLSAAIHTPTLYSKISDSYNRSMETFWRDENPLIASYANSYKFSLSTPFKFNVGAGFIIQKRAFVSAEYEYYNYSHAKLYADGYDFTQENSNTKESLKAAHQIRIGGELNITSSFMLRAGYSIKTSPYRSSTPEFANANNLTHYGSFGFGIRSKYVYFDLAYQLRYGNDPYTLYNTYAGNITAQIENMTHRIIATIGCKF